MQVQRFKIPKKLEPLFHDKRYRYYIMRGGRGGGKSTTACLAALLHGMKKKHRILATREYQVSIKDSVHKLLSDLIEEYKLDWFYTITRDSIVGRNGTEFIFKGLRQNIGSVKSVEGISICIVEEAQFVSESSFKILLPTIREQGSEIWILFNPVLESDDCYQRFVVHKPSNSLEIIINWNDNPFISPTLIAEKDDDYRRDPIAARNVWGGECRPAVEGAIYQNEFEFLEATNRIIDLPYTPDLPVNTYWDLGRRDATAIWFAQHAIGEEHRFIDYYENTGKDLGHYSEIVLNKGYNLGEHYLPHDVQVTELSSGVSRIDTLYKHGLKNIITVPRVREIETGIEATRQIFKQCWFDKERCKQGLHALKSYRYEYDDKLKCYKRDKPLHDWASNGSDAFRQFAQAYQLPTNDHIPLNDDAPMDWWEL
jgi:phage terminase large subunit